MRGIIGISAKAGKLVYGSELCVLSIQKQKAKLVIVAEDASLGTKKRFRDKCTYYKIPIIEYATKEELGAMTGKSPKAVLAVTDFGLGEAILNRVRKDD